MVSSQPAIQCVQCPNDCDIQRWSFSFPSPPHERPTRQDKTDRSSLDLLWALCNCVHLLLQCSTFFFKSDFASNFLQPLPWSVIIRINNVYLKIYIWQATAFPFISPHITTTHPYLVSNWAPINLSQCHLKWPERNPLNDRLNGHQV